jgi:hypothetical protein
VLNETEIFIKALFQFSVHNILSVLVRACMCVCVCLYSAVVVGNIFSEAENITRKCKMLRKYKFHIFTFSLRSFLCLA